MIKAPVVPSRSGRIAATRLHLTYVERDGVDKDGSQGKLYSHGLGADKVDSLGVARCSGRGMIPSAGWCNVQSGRGKVLARWPLPLGGSGIGGAKP